MTKTIDMNYVLLIILVGCIVILTGCVSAASTDTRALAETIVGLRFPRGSLDRDGKVVSRADIVLLPTTLQWPLLSPFAATKYQYYDGAATVIVVDNTASDTQCFTVIERTWTGSNETVAIMELKKYKTWIITKSHDMPALSD